MPRTCPSASSTWCAATTFATPASRIRNAWRAAKRRKKKTKSDLVVQTQRAALEPPFVFVALDALRRWGHVALRFDVGAFEKKAFHLLSQVLARARIGQIQAVF